MKSPEECLRSYLNFPETEKMTLPLLRKKYIGLRFDPQRFREGPDCWNLETENGCARFHYYWDDIEDECGLKATFNTYMNEIEIRYSPDMRITAIEPIEASIEEYADIRYSRYDTCLANLSNDEVFTLSEVVNQMLDMLPQELFGNASKGTGCEAG